MGGVNSILSFQTASAALEQGYAAIQAGTTEFDLGSVGAADSSAVALLLAWQRRARAAGQPLVYLNVPASLRKLASLYGVDELLVEKS
jgi:phospholipid transport system transporter-binding protein